MWIIFCLNVLIWKSALLYFCSLIDEIFIVSTLAIITFGLSIISIHFATSKKTCNVPKVTKTMSFKKDFVIHSIIPSLAWQLYALCASGTYSLWKGPKVTWNFFWTVHVKDVNSFSSRGRLRFCVSLRLIDNWNLSNCFKVLKS